MAKNEKTQPVKSSKARNDNRPNGKAWKKSWGVGGPPKPVVDLAATQSALSKRKKAGKSA